MFTPLDDTISVAGQLRPQDIAAAAAAGYATIVNNRPDGEQPGQPADAEMRAAAKAAGLAYHAIPVGHAGLSSTQVDAMRTAIDEANGPLLAFCRSGTRSTMLWALARSRMGDDPATLFGKAAAAGYDLTPIRPMLGR